MAARVLAAVGALLFIVGSVSAFTLNAPATTSGANTYELPDAAWLGVARAPGFDPHSLAELPKFEQRVLADGRVSPQEYHQAALRMTACFARAGLDWELTSEDGRWAYEYGGRGRPGESEESFEARIDRTNAYCSKTYFHLVSVWWEAQRQQAARSA